MPNPNADILWMARFNLEAGEAPGEHIMALRSGPNRALVSKHLKQIVDAHNTASPDNEMKILSLTQTTEEEFDAAVHELRTREGVVRVDAAEVYPDEKDRIRLIAAKRREDEVAVTQ